VGLSYLIIQPVFDLQTIEAIKITTVVGDKRCSEMTGKLEFDGYPNGRLLSDIRKACYSNSGWSILQKSSSLHIPPDNSIFKGRAIGGRIKTKHRPPVEYIKRVSVEASVFMRIIDKQLCISRCLGMVCICD
jgi:hypothetical protein